MEVRRNTHWHLGATHFFIRVIIREKGEVKKARYRLLFLWVNCNNAPWRCTECGETGWCMNMIINLRICKFQNSTKWQTLNHFCFKWLKPYASITQIIFTHVIYNTLLSCTLFPRKISKQISSVEKKKLLLLLFPICSFYHFWLHLGLCLGNKIRPFQDILEEFYTAWAKKVTA